MRRSLPFFLCLGMLDGGLAFGTVVITEIHYHPPDSAGRRLEFIEVRNPSAAPMSLTGWRLKGAVDFTFGEESVLEPGGYLVVAKDRAALEAGLGVPSTGIAGE